MANRRLLENGSFRLVEDGGVRLLERQDTIFSTQYTPPPVNYVWPGPETGNRKYVDRYDPVVEHLRWLTRKSRN
jgi:hypothetical protein